MPKSNQPFLDAAKAEDTADLLNHIAWTDVIHPALQRERELYTKLLVSSTLGMPVRTASAGGPVELTKEQLAGKIYGIDFITDLLEKILTKGDKAIAELHAQGIHLT